MKNEGTMIGLFVEHSKGEYEGTSYNSVAISDGLSPIKIDSPTLGEKLTYKRGAKVEVKFTLEPKKDRTAKVILKSIEEIK